MITLELTDQQYMDLYYVVIRRRLQLRNPSNQPYNDEEYKMLDDLIDLLEQKK